MSSTINTSIPVANSAIASAPIRSNFQSAANDINALYALIAALPSGGLAPAIFNVNTNANAGSSPAFYYYFCTGTVTLTIPTAVGNTNPYWIQNAGTGIITIAFSSGQNANGQTAIILDQQYRANLIISNGTNFGIVS